jgi:hypothetical protein
MGLDMYLKGRKFFWRNYEARDNERKEDGYQVESLDIRLGYWRKHPNLHGYLVQTFMGGKDDCQEIELTADNLRDIIAAVKAKRLPKTEGFFFGASDGSDEERDEDLTQLTKALLWLEATDPEPFEGEVTKGPGFTAVIVKPETGRRVKPQNITRSVHYQASW